MNKQELDLLFCSLPAVSVFRAVTEKPAMKTLCKFISHDDKDMFGKMKLYGEFVNSLSQYGFSFSDFLKKSIYEDENEYVIRTANSKEIPPCLENNAKRELDIFSSLTSLTPEILCSFAPKGVYIPSFINEETDFNRQYESRLKNISSYGYGIFSSAVMFRVENNEIIPVHSADSIDESVFVGYEEERKKVYDNTQALIEGRPAANTLLFGDAGTGKSSTVKACVNHFAPRGLRLIELRKDQLFSLSKIMDSIAENPLKFIIFIDDLSFNKNDDCFSMLKAALEGSASAKADNAVIYATSNRRHIVKENFSDREDDNDIHHSDTVQELMSLSDRFGLTVYFSRPNKALYLDIIHALALRHGITPDAELDRKAENFALAKGSRSPRAAEQFINSVI